MSTIDDFFEEAQKLLMLSNLDLLDKEDEVSKTAAKLAVELVKLRRAYVGLTNITMHMLIRQQVIESLLGLDGKTIDEMVSAIGSEVQTLEQFKNSRTLKALHERLTPGVQEVPPVRQS